MAGYAQGQFSKQEMMDKFGLNDQNLAKENKGSSTGAKGHFMFGEGYMTDDVVNKMLADPMLEATFQEKRKGGSDKKPNKFNSVNDLDSVMHYIASKEEEAPAKPETPKTEAIKYSQPLTRARAYVAQKDFSDMVGETTQSKFGYNPVSGSKSWTREDGQGIAANFMDQYMTRVKDPNYEVNPDQTATGELRADATGRGAIASRSTNTPLPPGTTEEFNITPSSSLRDQWGSGEDYRGADRIKKSDEQTDNTLGMP